jgi:hypothetical protein
MEIRFPVWGIGSRGFEPEPKNISTNATLGRKTFPGEGINTEISPHRFASVEMTKGEGGALVEKTKGKAALWSRLQRGRRVSRRKKTERPRLPLTNPFDWKPRLLLLSSQPKRSEVERLYVLIPIPGNVF